jgi:hypothetical protein
VSAGQQYTFELTIPQPPTTAWVGIGPGSNYPRGKSSYPGQVLAFHTWVVTS